MRACQPLVDVCALVQAHVRAHMPVLLWHLLLLLLQVLSVLRLHLCRVLLQVHMCEASRAATAH